MSDTADWKISEEEAMFSAPPFVTVTKRKAHLPNGHVINDFYRVVLRPYALVVPMTPEGKVLTITGYRPGPGAVATGFPGGVIEKGESTEIAVRRELEEETGYTAGELISLGQYTDDANQTCGVGTFFLAKDCVPMGKIDPELTESFTLALEDPADLDARAREGKFIMTHSALAWALARMHL